jgi:hypothetical protein
MRAFWSRCMSRRKCAAIVSSWELSEAAIRKRPEPKATTRHVAGGSVRASRQ